MNQTIDRPDSAVRLLFLVGTVLFFSGCFVLPEAPSIEIQDRGGVVYRINQEKPYTGRVVHHSRSGSLLWRARIVQGSVLEYTSFHPEGQLHLRCSFKRAPYEVMGKPWEQLLEAYQNLLDGDLQVFHDNGNSHITISFKNGLPYGQSRFLYPDGQIEQIAHFHPNENARIERFAPQGWKSLEINLCEASLSDLFLPSDRLRIECIWRMDGNYFRMHNEEVMAEQGQFACGRGVVQFTRWLEDGTDPAIPVPGKPFTIGFQRDVADIQMLWVDPGTFMMGAPLDEPEREEDETLHQVTLTHGFWMAAHQVTQAQWEAIMGYNPSYFRGDPTLPVESMTWAMAMEFCKRLEAGGRRWGLIPNGYTISLPTEAQWEYACRAGTQTPFAGDINEMAWYHQNAKSKTHPVGMKQPNAWGFYDMHGNVWEMCLDWERVYPDHPEVDPIGVDPGTYYVARGAGWGHGTAHIRSANRGYLTPTSQSMSHGLRIAIIPVQYHQRLKEARPIEAPK